MQFSSVLLLCYIILGCNQSTEASSDIETISVNSQFELAVPLDELHLKEGLYYYGDKAFNGAAIQYYNNKIISEKTAFAKGKKHGLQEKFFENGTRSFQANYVNGLRHGKVISWRKNGVKRSEANYKNGIAQGKQYQWYPSGAKFKTITLVDGKEEGLQQSWRENGKLYNNYEAKNGRIFGLKRATLCFQLDDEEVQVTER